MKIYIAKTLCETPDGNYCLTEVFRTRSAANEWASRKIDEIAEGYTDTQVEKNEDFYRMWNNFYEMFGTDTYITIEIEEKELDL